MIQAWSRRTWRCATLLDRCNGISVVGCSKSAIIFVSCDLLLQLRNWHMHVGLLHFFGRFVLAQLISCSSSTAIPVAVSVNFPAWTRILFSRGRLLHVVEDATLLSVFRVTLGGNESFMHYTLRILTPETWRSRRRPAPCLFHIILENDQAELEPKKLETAGSSSLRGQR